MKLKLLVFGVIVALIVTGCSQKESQNSKVLGVKLAEDLKKAYNSTKSISGMENLTITENGKNYSDCVKFVIVKPNKVWMYDITHNAYLISNGTYTWVYDKNRNIVKVGKIKPEHPPDYAMYVNGLLTLFDVSYVGNKTFNGEVCKTLKIVPNGSTNINVYGYMYIKNNKVKGIYFRLNNIVYNIVFKNVRYNVSVNNTTFNFTPPKGAKIYRIIEQVKIKSYRSIEEAQKHVQFKIVSPTYTAGYRLTGVYTYGSTVLLKYNNKNEVMLIRECNTSAFMTSMKNVKNVSIGNVTVYIWNNNGKTNAIFSVKGVSISISAPMNETQIIEVCRSMVS